MEDLSNASIEQAPQVPFGTEMLTVTKEDVTTLGALACIQNLGSGPTDDV